MGVVQQVLRGTSVASTWGVERRKPSPAGYDALIEYLEDTLNLDDDDFSSLDYAFKIIEEKLSGRGVEMTEAFSAALNNDKVVPSIVDERNDAFVQRVRSQAQGASSLGAVENLSYDVVDDDSLQNTEKSFRDLRTAKEIVARRIVELDRKVPVKKNTNFGDRVKKLRRVAAFNYINAQATPDVFGIVQERIAELERIEKERGGQNV